MTLEEWLAVWLDGWAYRRLTRLRVPEDDRAALATAFAQWCIRQLRQLRHLPPGLLHRLPIFADAEWEHWLQSAHLRTGMETSDR
jgi:hypothetical protein